MAAARNIYVIIDLMKVTSNIFKPGTVWKSWYRNWII